MKFYGLKRVIRHDENYGQMRAIDDFWAQMRADHPNVDFVSLGKNWGVDSFDYYIGKIDEDWDKSLETVELPDNDWKISQCPRNDEEIEKMYRQIWDQGKLDYEIEELLDDILVVKAHYTNEEAEHEI